MTKTELSTVKVGIIPAPIVIRKKDFAQNVERD